MLSYGTFELLIDSDIIYADTGRKEKALESLKEAETAFREMGMDYWLRRTQEVLKRLEG